MQSQSKSRKPRKVFTAAEKAEYREAKRNEERERFASAIDELTSSEGWRRWVDSRSMFHRYSFGNSVLIASQRPDATIVAPYKTWQKAGRQVRKGEHGIAITVPMRVKVRAGQEPAKRPGISHSATVAQAQAAGRKSYEESAGDGESKSVLRFKTGHVFDVSQTDGDALPTLERYPIEGDSHAEYLPKLEALASELGYRVTFRDLCDHAAKGWCDPQVKELVIDSGQPVNAQVRTLVHELAHALGVGYAEYGRETAEVIVETAAVIACSSMGLDTSGESVPYVASYANGDAAKVHEFAAKVDECARRIESALDIDELALYGEAA